MAIVPAKTLLELGWPSLVAALVGEARTPVGIELARALPFQPDRDAVLRQLSRVGECRKLAQQSLEVPVGGTPDVRTFIGRAGREGVLEPIGLLECARLMRAATRVRRFLQTRSHLAPMLAAEAASLSDLDPLAVEIERAIEPSGTISDHASPLLAELRERSRGLHRHIKTKIDDLLRDEQNQEILRDNYYTIRDDRYCIPVKASFKSRMPGIVHNASQSGQTLFIEPEPLMDLGNALTIAQAMALEEERRILRDLTEAVGRRSGELAQDQLTLAEFDRVGACARLADRLGATEPELAPPGEGFVLRRLRHPLLALRGVHVVANDVVLGEGKRGLVVSGPNAGGKTVTLTAVGLCALMTRAGLPVPADAGSRVPLYRAVYTAIGDEGDLSKDLSTFTAHLTALRDIAKDTIPGTLVCIDEIAADTDPREGAALASAMLEQLVESGAQVLITTHLDEVKAKGLTDERFLTASVGFDFERLAPTYELRMNVVGASSAIEIARRVGLPASVCDRARALLTGGGGALDRAVAALDRERGELRRLMRSLDDEKQALTRAREEWERQKRALEQREKELQAGARRDLLREIDSARDEVRQRIARLQGEHTVRAAVEAQRALEKEAEKQAAEIARAEAKAAALSGNEASSVPLRPGLRVKVASVGREGEILEIDGEEAVVAVGALKARVPVGDLVALTGRTKNAPRLRRSREEREAKVEESRPQVLKLESPKIDLRGLRTEDALRELRAGMDKLYREDNSEISVVHGHGTGALKQAVREELGSSAYVESFRRGEAHEGGDGVTIVRMRSR